MSHNNHQAQRSQQTIFDYWRTKVVTDDDKNREIGAVRARKTIPHFDGIIYNLQDDPGLRGSGAMTIKDTTIKLTSFGLTRLNGHPVFGPTMSEIERLHHDIHISCGEEGSKQRILETVYTFEKFPTRDFTLYTGTRVRNYIDDKSHRVGLTKATLAYILFYLGLEEYDFTEVHERSGFINDSVDAQLLEAKNMLIDRLVILRGFAREFFID